MGLDSVGPSGGESSKRKGEGSLVRGGPIHAAQEAGPRSDRVGHHPLARSAAKESGSLAAVLASGIFLLFLFHLEQWVVGADV
jgi:hypothetical protein